MAQPTETYQPGQRVKIVQQIPHRSRVWTTELQGEAVKYEQAKTGSWFAHAKDDRLWLDRLHLRKVDGEVVIVNLDSYTHVETVSGEQNPQNTA